MHCLEIGIPPLLNSTFQYFIEIAERFCRYKERVVILTILDDLVITEERIKMHRHFQFTFLSR